MSTCSYAIASDEFQQTWLVSVVPIPSSEDRVPHFGDATFIIAEEFKEWYDSSEVDHE